jgi:hypothetical protein
MGVWEFFVNTLGVVATVLMLLVLRWAAVARAAAHREWTERRRELAERDAAFVDWCVATWAVAGCL